MPEGVKLRRPKKILQRSDLPHPDLFNHNKRRAKHNDQRVHVLLTLALELMLKRRRDTKYHNNEIYLAFHKYCIYLAIESARYLSDNMQTKYTSEDKHHDDSYNRIQGILNKRFDILPHTPRKKSSKRVEFSEVMVPRCGSNSLDRHIFDYDFGKKEPTLNINQGGTRTYYLYATVFGLCTLRMLAQRVVFALKQMDWLSTFTTLHKVAEPYLPIITCALLGIELLFELAIVVRAMVRGKSGYKKSIKDNRPWRFIYAAGTMALILCSSMMPICNVVLMAGFDLFHSLCMDFEKYRTLKRLQAQLIDNTVDECKDYPDSRLMGPNIRREFMVALSWKLTKHVFKMVATFLCLAVLCAGVLLLASNPFVSSVCIIVGAGCAFINRVIMMSKMSDTPGVPKSLERRCKSHADPKGRSILPSTTQRKVMNGKVYAAVAEEADPDPFLSPSSTGSSRRLG